MPNNSKVGNREFCWNNEPNGLGRSRSSGLPRLDDGGVTGATGPDVRSNPGNRDDGSNDEPGSRGFDEPIGGNNDDNASNGCGGGGTRGRSNPGGLPIGPTTEGGLIFGSLDSKSDLSRSSALMAPAVKLGISSARSLF